VPGFLPMRDLLGPEHADRHRSPVAAAAWRDPRQLIRQVRNSPEAIVKGLAALVAAAFIAAASALWFTTKSALVAVETAPLQPSSDLPTFKPVR
jgi:hypothetical protein